MGIVMKTPSSEISAYLNRVYLDIAKAITTALSYLGDQCVTRIRERKDNWIDRTGNLRSSIGFAVLETGKVKVQSAFEQFSTGTEGVAAGKEYINDLAAQYANTYALVVVAGMDYAEYVERMESKDVLASTKIWAEQKVDSYISRAIQAALKKYR